MPQLKRTPLFFYTGSGIEEAHFAEFKPIGVFRKGVTQIVDMLNRIERAYWEDLASPRSQLLE